MNYSTIKKVVAYSMLSALGVTAASAQETATTGSAAKVFGGRGQYRTWSFGLNAGVLAPVVLTGGSNDFNHWDVNLGYGFTLRKQLGHSFGLELSGLKGDLSGDNIPETDATPAEAASDNQNRISTNRTSFETSLSYSGALSAVFNVATIDFLRRENSVNFIVKAGYGIAAYKQTELTNAAGQNLVPNGGFRYGPDRDRKRTYEAFIPVGLGVKFKLSDRVNFDLGYSMNYLDGDNMDLTYGRGTSKDKFSYASAGIEFSLGSSAKPNLDWANPVAAMYDELKDPTLRQEVEALKGRVSTLENTVNQLSADADGDGVSNKFDKCPNTPAGTQVDGAGCPIKFPEPVAVTSTGGMASSYSSIMFEFDSSVLKTSSYPTLDKLSADLRATAGRTISLDGYASAEGTDEYNTRLSTDRANSVKTYLVNSGVDASRISVKGYGEANPVASNATEEGRIQNRRVEIK